MPPPKRRNFLKWGSSKISVILPGASISIGPEDPGDIRTEMNASPDRAPRASRHVHFSRLPSWMRFNTQHILGPFTAVGARILSIAVGVVVLLLGIPHGSGGATPLAAGSLEEARVLNDRLLITPNGAATDTIYVAFMDPLIVIGYRSDQTFTGTLVSAEPSGDDAATTAETTRSPAEGSTDVMRDGVSIGGLIVNETFSVIGNQFVRAFEDRWTEPEGVQDFGYTITLGENPAPSLGAQVFVEVEGRRLFQGYLRPNRRQIQQAARQAVQRATLYLQKYYEPREVY